MIQRNGHGGSGLRRKPGSLQRRNQDFGFAAALGGLLGIVGGAMAVALLRGLPYPTNFAVCFACCCAALALGFTILTQAREPLLVYESSSFL